jgi:hypothetical protein
MFDSSTDELSQVIDCHPLRVNFDTVVILNDTTHELDKGWLCLEQERLTDRNITGKSAFHPYSLSLRPLR